MKKQCIAGTKIKMPVNRCYPDCEFIYNKKDVSEITPFSLLSGIRPDRVFYRSSFLFLPAARMAIRETRESIIHPASELLSDVLTAPLSGFPPF